MDFGPGTTHISSASRTLRTPPRMIGDLGKVWTDAVGVEFATGAKSPDSGASHNLNLLCPRKPLLSKQAEDRFKALRGSNPTLLKCQETYLLNGLAEVCADGWGLTNPSL